MYLNCGTRPDITSMIEQLSCHNSNPQIKYLCIIKQILHYLKRIIILGIKWRNNFEGHQLREKYKELGVVGYVDSS